jgi:hypothetical protein
MGDTFIVGSRKEGTYGSTRKTKHRAWDRTGPAMKSGCPIIEGTRVLVDRIVGHLDHGVSRGEICLEYELTPE